MNNLITKIKILRDLTGVGFLECKNALLENNENIELATTLLKEKGLIKITKKSNRVTKEGIITSYIHTGGKLGVLLEINCETDFVARHNDFQLLAKNLAIHIASNTDVIYISENDIPEEKKKELNNDNILLKQYYIFNPTITIEDYINKLILSLGENIKINRFCKFVIN